MKYLILIVVLSITAAAQDTCFTKKQLLDIGNGVRRMEYTQAYSDSLIAEQQKQIAAQQALLVLRDSTISTLKWQVSLLKTNVELHNQAMKKMEQIIANQKSNTLNDVLYAVIGFGAGFLLFHK